MRGQFTSPTIGRTLAIRTCERVKQTYQAIISSENVKTRRRCVCLPLPWRREEKVEAQVAKAEVHSKDDLSCNFKLTNMNAFSNIVGSSINTDHIEAQTASLIDNVNGYLRLIYNLLSKRMNLSRHAQEGELSDFGYLSRFYEIWRLICHGENALNLFSR